MSTPSKPATTNDRAPVTMTVGDIVDLLGVSFTGDRSKSITGVNALEDALPTEVSFLASDAYVKNFRKTKAGLVLVQDRVKLPAGQATPIVFVPNAEQAVAKLLKRFAPDVQRPGVGIDASANVAKDAVIGEGTGVGPNVVIGLRTRIGKNCQIHPGVVIGDDVTLGDDCAIYPNVVIRERVTIGHRVIIHAGSVLGSDGFGYRWDGRGHAKIPQIGSIIIEDDVEIGSCVCVDRARFSTTRIGRGSKIDNLVQVAHNVQVGPHCIVVGQSGMAGSVKLGAGVIIGGQAAIRDHVSLGDGAMVAACSGVADDVQPKSIVSGIPALPHRQSLRESAALRRLPDLVVQVRKLQEEIAKLKEGR